MRLSVATIALFGLLLATYVNVAAASDPVTVPFKNCGDVRSPREALDLACTDLLPSRCMCASTSSLCFTRAVRRPSRSQRSESVGVAACQGYRSNRCARTRLFTDPAPLSLCVCCRGTGKRLELRLSAELHDETVDGGSYELRTNTSTHTYTHARRRCQCAERLPLPLHVCRGEVRRHSAHDQDGGHQRARSHTPRQTGYVTREAHSRIAR
jgi:hypothetical protein